MRKSKAIKEALLDLKSCRSYPIGFQLSYDLAGEYDKQIEEDRRDVLEKLWNRAIRNISKSK